MADEDDGVEAAQTALAAAEHAHAVADSIEREYQEEVQRCDTLRAKYADENDDVEALEGWTVTRIIASLTGRRESKLFDERAERDVARLELSVREEVLAGLSDELDAARANAGDLDVARAAVEKAINDRGLRLLGQDGPRGQKLAVIVDQATRFRAKQTEVREGLDYAAIARAALDHAAQKLSSAGGWSTYDTFFGGGLISGSIKHDRMAEAAAQIRVVHQSLLRLKAELSDIDGPLMGELELPSSLLTGLDLWFDNLFSDWMVHDRIQASQDSVRSTTAHVSEMQRKLTALEATLQTNLERLATERNEVILEGPS